MYSAWDAPALRKEALDSSRSLQQLLPWISVVAGLECDEGAEDQAASRSLQGCTYRRAKGPFSSPFPPVPSAPGPVWSLGGGTAPLLHQPPGPITAASSPPGRELLLGLSDLGATGHA